MSTTLVIPQGADWAVYWPVTPDPTGGAVRAQVRTSPGASTVLHEWSTANGTAIVNSTGVTLVVTPAASSAWEWRHGVYDVELTLSGKTYRIAEGTVTVSPEVTR